MKRFTSAALSTVLAGLTATPAFAMFEPVHVPDMASTAGLLGLGLIGLVGVRRWMSRR